MKRNRIGYYIKEGTLGIFNHGLMSFVTVCIIIACLVIMGIFSLLALNMNSIIDTLEDQNQIVAFVDENYTKEEAMALETALEDLPNVADAAFISRDDAMVSFKEEYKDSTLLLEDLESDVLRDRFVIYLEDIKLMKDTRDDLTSVEGIAEVNIHEEIAEGFIYVRNIVGIVSIVLVAILLVISLFIMSNTIKLTTFERRDEIAIMKMVGATNRFIKWPFVVEGIMLGMFGALSAYIIEWGAYTLLVERVLDGSRLSFLEFLPFASFAVPLVIMFVIIGLGVGIIGSLVAIKNYLKV